MYFILWEIILLRRRIAVIIKNWLVLLRTKFTKMKCSDGDHFEKALRGKKTKHKMIPIKATLFSEKLLLFLYITVWYLL